MAGYSPLKITGNSTGLVQEREEFLLPDDAYPTLQNAYVWRERILRKKGYQLLGRLQRTENVNNNETGGSLNLFTSLSLESTSTITPGGINVTGAIDGSTYTDPNANGVLVATGGTGTGGRINYVTGILQINSASGNLNQLLTGTIQYYPGLPVMGIRTRELLNIDNDQTVFFDQNYAYVFNSSSNKFIEFIPGTTWNAHNGNVTATDFFWSTNYWTSSTPIFSTTGTKLFWVINNTGQFGATSDPPRITDGTTWVSWWTAPGGMFTPQPWTQLDSTNYLVNWLAMLPFRGRMVVFNTWEGINQISAQNYYNRIRWSTIGNPFIAYASGPPATGSWRDDIRGQGGYLDIPTSEDIISVGFVRDNLVIYCEKSTWQLRYTGRSIAPFQIEKVNSELGTFGPLSTIQFDTSLLGIGQRGIVECDSYKSERIDIKIPDFVFQLQNNNNGQFRIHGIRDFINRLAYWTFPVDPSGSIYPTQRLVYNYENDSWALFNDSLTTLGTFQPSSSRTWLNTNLPWIQCNFAWIENFTASSPQIVGGNQQGFVEFLDEQTVNDPSLYISSITSSISTATVITCPNHNMSTGFVIGISGILPPQVGLGYTDMNEQVFGIIVINSNQFQLMSYNPSTGTFSTPFTHRSLSYIGGGVINIRENFSIISKKFNFLDEGQSIQMGYLDILMSSTESSNPGAISLNVYIDYDDDNVSNIFPQNQLLYENPPVSPDTFFNSTIPTTPSSLGEAQEGSKFWQRVYCATRGNFLTLQYTFSNAQMAGIEQEQDVQIDAQVLWIRKAGRMTQM